MIFGYFTPAYLKIKSLSDFIKQPLYPFSHLLFCNDKCPQKGFLLEVVSRSGFESWDLLYVQVSHALGVGLDKGSAWGDLFTH
jgi:hypothetical protein